MSNEIPLLMPKMSMTMTEGELATWHKSVGDSVATGEVVCEVMTDKVDMEVESPVDGVISRILIAEGEVVPVGEPIAFITSEADDLLGDLLAPPETPVGGAVSTAASPIGIPTDTPTGDPTDTADDSLPSAEPHADSVIPEPETPREPAVTQSASADTPVAAPVAPQGPSPVGPVVEPQGQSPVGPVAAIPRARGMARAAGLDLATIKGSGPDGLITVADVERALGTTTPVRSAAPVATAPRPTVQPTVRPTVTTPAPAAGDEKRKATVRARVGALMSQSALIPQFTAWRDLDLEAMAAQRGAVSWNTLLVRALAQALRETPALNGTFVDGAFVPGENVSVGLAIDSSVGLLAPTLVDPDLADVEELDSELRTLITRARTGKIDARYLAPATTALSNLGSLGVERFNAMLTPPQVTALSVGAVTRKPVAHHGGMALRVTTTVGLTVDHRAADGADAARLLATLADLVSAPQRLM
jgi:pyruvate dehydrogenase E2 component (dihydrolipoamide acetyltransferase)